MQKHAHLKWGNSVNANQSFIKNKKWWWGFGIHVIGNLIVTLSYGFGPASLLLPLDTLKIAFTTALAAKYLNEKVTKKEVIGIGIIILSAVISTLFGPRSTESYYTILDIKWRYNQPGFLAVAGILSGYTLLNYLCLLINNSTPILNKFSSYITDEFNMISYLNIAAFFAAWNVLLDKCIL